MSFSLDLARFGEEAIGNAEKIVRKIGFNLHARIVKRTPVDTGRAKANQQISINSLPSGSVLEFDRLGNATISKGERALSSFNLGDTIFLYNNLEYIVPLEYGHSQKQAPSGMFRISFEEIVQNIGGTAT